MKLTTGMVLVGTFLAGLASAASADVITDWNEKIVNTSLAAQQPPPGAGEKHRHGASGDV